MASKVLKLVPKSTVFFIIDLQTKFRPAVYEFDRVVSTTNKMLKVAKLLNIPVIVSEQNPSKLGKTVDQLDLAHIGPLHRKTIEKTLFSLVTPELDAVMDAENEKSHIESVVLMGIESHICVLQTALDLLERNYDVHILADGVSSCNREEVPLALERLKQANAQISTSESVAYQLMADAGKPEFKAFAQVIKEETEATRNSVQALLGLGKTERQ